MIINQTGLKWKGKGGVEVSGGVNKRLKLTGKELTE